MSDIEKSLCWTCVHGRCVSSRNPTVEEDEPEEEEDTGPSFESWNASSEDFGEDLHAVNPLNNMVSRFIAMETGPNSIIVNYCYFPYSRERLLQSGGGENLMADPRELSGVINKCNTYRKEEV